MNEAIARQASGIARRAADRGLGLPIAVITSIVTIALPLISQMLAGCGGAKAAKRLAVNHYDEVSGEFDSRAIKQLRPEMRDAVRVHNRQTGESVRPTKFQLDGMAIATLEQAREEKWSDVASCMSAAAEVPIDGEVDDGQ